MFKGIMRLMTRIGYIRAANELSRTGHIELAEKLRKQARRLKVG